MPTWMRSWVVDVAGETGDHGRMVTEPIASHVEAYLARARDVRGLSRHTIEAYRRDLAGFVEFSRRYGIVDIHDVDRRLVRRFSANLSESELPSATFPPSILSTRGTSSMRRSHTSGSVPFSTRWM